MSATSPSAVTAGVIVFAEGCAAVESVSCHAPGHQRLDHLCVRAACTFGGAKREVCRHESRTGMQYNSPYVFGKALADLVHQALAPLIFTLFFAFLATPTLPIHVLYTIVFGAYFACSGASYVISSITLPPGRWCSPQALSSSPFSWKGSSVRCATWKRSLAGVPVLRFLESSTLTGRLSHSTWQPYDHIPTSTIHTLLSLTTVSFRATRH
mmetsp:Transcript_13213/g.41639  ORF Transcript_13213/g.41639 Transcript_13213/m.41639 type:complete len:211 (-) Transcript_13213:140-772(-)